MAPHVRQVSDISSCHQMASSYTVGSLHEEILMLVKNRSIWRAAKKTMALTAFASIAMVATMVASAQDAPKMPDGIPKFMIVQMAADNATVLCQSEGFTQCMGFTLERCHELKDEAIDTCLGPLPDTINPAELQNESLEACPRKVYADAGFPEEKAEMCFQKVAGPPPQPANPTDPTVEPDATTVDEPEEPASPEAPSSD